MKKLLHHRLLSVIMLVMFGLSALAETAEVVIQTYASNNNWINGTQYKTVNIGDIATATASTKSTGNTNTGKYYTNGYDWRFYQNETPTLKIAGNEGYTLTSVKITYNKANTGTLTLDGTAVTSATSTAVTNNEISFSVGNTGTATNGQVKITKIEITYETDGVSIAKPAFGTANGIVAAGTNVVLTCATEGVDIYYATAAELNKTNPTAAEIVAANHNGSTITVDATNTYFAVATDGENYSGIATASYTVLAHAGTEVDPYNVADAIIVANANGTSSTENVYVTGYIAKIDSNTAFFITDAANGSGDQLEIYNAANPNNFTFEVGDKVVVCAPLIMYKTTPETSGGNIINVIGKLPCGLAWSAEEVTYYIGESALTDLPKLVNPNNLTVTYSSEDQDVATIDTDGTVTIVKPGVTIITAKFAGNDAYKIGEAEYILAVEDPSITTLTCIVNISDQTISYGNGKTVTWVAENGTKFNTIATISGNNTYPAKTSQNNLRLYHKSNNIITVTAPDGFYFAKFSSVTESGSKVTLPTNVVFTVGTTSETATADNGAVSYTFTNPTNEFSFNINLEENGDNADFSTITLVINKYSAGVEIYDGYAYGNKAEAAGCAIAYMRDFKRTSWQPWYVPFAVAADEFDKAVVLTGADAANNTLEFTTVTGSLDGNKPYMVQPKKAETAIIEVEGTLLAAASESITFNGYTITGIYDEKTDMATSNSYAIAADGNFHPATSDEVVLKPFRVYLTVPAAQAGKPVRVVIDNEEVDGIEGIYIEDAENGNIYDLQGRRVLNPGNGIFIVNGKKTFINK